MSDLSGLQIVSLIIKNEFDEICPEYKVKTVLNKSNKAKKAKEELVNKVKYDTEVEYTLYRAFNDDVNLCKLYLRESPNCLELFKILNLNEGNKGDRIVNTRVIALLLYVLHNNERHKLLTKSNELKVTQNVLESFLRNIETIFVNDDVIINYSLKLLIESVKRVNLEFLGQFSEKFDFVKYLGKCHVTNSPDKNFTLVNHFRRYLKETGISESLETLVSQLDSSSNPKKRGHGELDLYYENGKLKLVMVVMTLARLNRSYDCQNILNEKILQILVSHLKGEHLLTQLILIHLLINILKNNVNNFMMRENSTLLNLVNVINNNIINLLNNSEMSSKADGKSLNSEGGNLTQKDKKGLVRISLQSMLEVFIGVLIGSKRFDEETVVGVLLKHKVSVMGERLKEVYSTNISLYGRYVDNISVGNCMKSFEDGSALVKMMSNYMEKLGKTPKFLTKSVVTNLVVSNPNFESWLGDDNRGLLEGLGRSFKLMVNLMDLKKVNLVPDVKTVLNYNQVLEKVLNSEKAKVNNIISVYEAYKNLLWLLSKYENNLRNTYDPLKFLNVPVIKNNYEYLSVRRLEKERLELKEGGNELMRIKLKLNLNLIKCMYSLGIGGNLVLNNQVKYFEVILYNYWIERELKVDTGECLLSYVKTILKGLIECQNSEELEVYIRNLEDEYLLKVFMSLYSLIVNENVNILYNNSNNSSNNNNNLVEGNLNYSCVNCVLKVKFCGNVLLYMLLNMLIMLVKPPGNCDSSGELSREGLGKVKCDGCNYSLVNIGKLIWNGEWQNREALLKEYILKVVSYYMKSESVLKSQVSKIVAHLNIHVEIDDYDNSRKNIIRNFANYITDNIINNNNANDTINGSNNNNLRIKTNVKIIRKLSERMNRENEEDVLNYIFYYVVKIVKDESVKIKFQFLKKEREDFVMSLLQNVTRGNHKKLAEKFVELLKDEEDDYKLTLMLILVNDVESLFKKVEMEGVKVIDLMLDKLERVDNCESNCGFFRCTLTKLYYLYKLVYKMINSSENKFRDGGKILYNRNFMSKCEFVLSRSFGGENSEYFYYGNNIEYKLYLITLKVLYSISHNPDFSLHTDNNNPNNTLSNSNKLDAFNFYYKLLRKNYKGTRNCDDLLIKGLLYRLIEAFEGTRSASFYMKLVKVNSFELAGEEARSKCRLHGLENKWMFWNDYAVYSRVENDTPIFGEYSLNMTRLQFTIINGDLSEKVDGSLERVRSEFENDPDNLEGKKLVNYYSYDMEYVVNYVYKSLLVAYYKNESPKNVDVLLVLIIGQLVMGGEIELVLNKIIDLMIMTSSEKGLKYILYHLRSNKDSQDCVKILSYIMDKYESLVNVNVLSGKGKVNKGTELTDTASKVTGGIDDGRDSKVNEYNRRKVQNSLKLVIKNNLSKRGRESMLMKRHRNQLLMYSLINENLVKVVNNEIIINK